MGVLLLAWGGGSDEPSCSVKGARCFRKWFGFLRGEIHRKTLNAHDLKRNKRAVAVWAGSRGSSVVLLVA